MYMPFMVYHALGKNEDVVNVTNHEIIQIFVDCSSSVFVRSKDIMMYSKWP
jgi:hypothetical protein